MIFRPDLAEKIVEGDKTQTRRPAKRNARDQLEPCRYRVGGTYAVQPGRGKPGIATILITQVRLSRLGLIGRDSATAEGFESVSEFAKAWVNIYDRWDTDEEVYVIDFRLVSA